jgi:hypothetical protein
MSEQDPLAGLKRMPDLWALFSQQPEQIQSAYLDWWQQRIETRGAHRDCLEPFLAGYRARDRALTRRKVVVHA